MSGLIYAGKTPASPRDLTNRVGVDTLVATLSPNRTSSAAQVSSTASATYASKSYVDSQDGTFVAPSYYQTKDALNVPNAALGAANGVATLDSSSKVPLAQMPNLGVPYLAGCYGPTATFSGTTGATKLRIADWNLGHAPAIPFKPLIFFQAFVSSLWGQAAIDITMTNTTTQPTYAAGTLVAQGTGRYLFNDPHPVTVLSAPSATGQTPTSPALNSAGYNIWISAWLYDLTGRSVTLSPGWIANAGVYLLRGSL